MSHDAPACAPNIGARGIHQRRRSGLLALGAAVVLGIALLALDAPGWSRLVVFLPLLAAGLGIFQASEKT